MIRKQLIVFTHPVADSMIYNALCKAHLQFQMISHELIDILYQARSRQALRAIDLSTGQAHIPHDPANLVNMILDDIVEVQLLEDYCYALTTFFAILFKEYLILCSTVDVNVDTTRVHESLSEPYPVTSWDLGPALRSNEALRISICIPLSDIKKVAIPEHGMYLFFYQGSNKWRSIDPRMFRPELISSPSNHTRENRDTVSSFKIA